MQPYKDKLTIILTLKGREEFTLSYLKYLDIIKFPFRVLIADGGKLNSNLENALYKKESFPNVDYKYIRFPEDKDLIFFYKKVLQTIDMVQTPYVMFNDNDDFPLPTGINRCIEFLEHNHEYIGAAGKVGGVTIKNNSAKENTAYGKIHNWHEYYFDIRYAPTSYEQNHIIDRIEYQLMINRSYFLHYNIYRVESFKNIYKSLIDNNINCLRLYEFFTIQALLSYGKVKGFLNFYTYIRQRGSSQAAKSMKNFWDLLYLERWMDTFDRYTKALSIIISSLNGEDSEKTELTLRKIHSMSNKLNDPNISISRKEKIKLILKSVWCFFKHRTRFRRYIPGYKSFDLFLKKKYLSLKLGHSNLSEKEEFSKITNKIEKLIKNKT